MDRFSEIIKILDRVDAAVAVISSHGEVWRNPCARTLLSEFSDGDLPGLLADSRKLDEYGLSASASESDDMTVYTLCRKEQPEKHGEKPDSTMLEELQDRDRRRELLVSICLVCAYSQGTLDGIYYAVSETARMLEADCASLFLADSESETWKSICLCTADGDNAGYSVRTDIPFDEFKVIEKRLDEKSCIILTGLPEAQLVSGEKAAVCASRVSSEKGLSAVLWLERRTAPENWAKAEEPFIYMLLGVLKMALRRSRMELELKEALRFAHEANAAKTEFFSSVSHEVRTPINAILGMTSLALDSSDQQEIHGYLEKVNSSGLYLLGIINDILDISCIEAGKFTLCPRSCLLREMIGSVCDMIAFAAEKKGLRFMLEIDESLPEYIFCDEQRLRQVLINLLNNAVKFTEEGTVALCAIRQSGESGDSLMLTVTDTGAGISPEDHDRIFSAYERLDGSVSRRTEGSGLGLRITQSIVDMMGGRIELNSDSGEGSTFTVTLPIAESDPSEMTENGQPVSFCAPNAKVLVVDDSEVSLVVTVGMLKKFGVCPESARNGKIAMDMCSARKYDIILMDHMMPVMDGETACRAIRSSGVNSETPIVALTANSTQTAAKALYSAGMNDILTKPLFREALGGMLLKWLPEELVDTDVQQALDDHRESSDDPGFSVGEALERMGGSHELLSEALELTCPALLEAIKIQGELLANGDLRALRIDAHGLKGVLNTIGAYETAELALQLEQACVQENPEAARMLWDEYEKALRRLYEAIRKYLGK